MPQSFLPIRPVVALTTGGQYNWTDIDVRPFGVPVDATGVILQVRNAGFVMNYGIRRNGNLDIRIGSTNSSTMHTCAVIGIEDGIFEFYNVGASPRVELDLVGYTRGGVDFTPSYINAPGISPVAAAWNAVDLSTFGVPPTAIGVIIEVYINAGVQVFGYRQNGSGDARLFNIHANHPTFSFVIGCDINQIIELYRQTNNVTFYLHGFITDGAVFYLNAIDITPGGVAAWWDLPRLPLHGIMPFIEVSGPGGNFGAREDVIVGSNTNTPQANHNFIIPSALTRNYQGNMQNVATTFHLVGYSSYSVPIGQSDPASGVS